MFVSCWNPIATFAGHRIWQERYVLFFLSTHLHILNKKIEYNHQVHKYQCTWDPSKKRLEQRMSINETVCLFR